MIRTAFVLVTLVGICYPSQAVTPMSSAEQEVRAAAAGYVEAFNRGDADSVAGYWSPEAVYANRMTSEEVTGRDAIAGQFEALFASSPDLKLAVDVQSVRFVSPNVAVENGTASFLSPDADPELVTYSAVYVRRSDEWLLDRVTDESRLVTDERSNRLLELQWMIGEWEDRDENATISTECNWTKSRSFITRQFGVSIGDQVRMSGMQIIGWDPVHEHVRSWTYDSDGGVSEGVWSRDGDRWYVRKKGFTADGRAVTALNIVTRLDDDAFKLQSIERSVAGTMLPNTDEVLVERR